MYSALGARVDAHGCSKDEEEECVQPLCLSHGMKDTEGTGHGEGNCFEPTTWKRHLGAPNIENLRTEEKSGPAMTCFTLVFPFRGYRVSEGPTSFDLRKGPEI